MILEPPHGPNPEATSLIPVKQINPRTRRGMVPRKALRRERPDLDAVLKTIFSNAHQGMHRTEFLRESARLLAENTPCDAFEVWLSERGKVYRCEHDLSKGGGPVEIFTERDCEAVRYPPEGEGTIDDLSCMILLRPGILPERLGGAFGTIDGTTVVEFSGTSGRSRPLLRVHPEGRYPCRAFIPLVLDGQLRGMLQLKCRTRKQFAMRDVHELDRLAPVFSEAFLLRHVNLSLQERVKELRCLYEMANVAARRESPLSEVLQSIADLLPSAFLHPDRATSAVVLDGQAYTAGAIHEAKSRLVSPFPVAGVLRGKLEVGYTAELPELDEGPFLQEERQLLDTVAREVSLIVERRSSEDENTRLQDQIRHADRLTMIGQLAASVAHELNEPMESILGFSQLLARSPAVSGQEKRDLDRVVEAALHARQVLRKLMTFARRGTDGRVVTNLNTIVNESIWYFRPRCIRGGIELVCKLSPDLPPLVSDPVQMHQVLINLVVNAIQAMPAGGTLTIMTQPEGNRVALIVEDTGIGMTEEVREKIFTPFFTTKDSSEGTGLGLSVVQGIVQAHGGSIHVDSTPGRGTCFRVLFPRGEAIGEGGTL